MYRLVTWDVSSATTAFPSVLLLMSGHFCLVLPTPSPSSLASRIHPTVTSLNGINSDAANLKFTQIGPGRIFFSLFSLSDKKLR